MRKKQLPKRIEILRKAFENKWSLEAVNKELEDNLCERLYARNIYEAGLIYAFCLGFDYENWKQLYTAYEEERKDARDYIQSPEKNIIATSNYHFSSWQELLHPIYGTNFVPKHRQQTIR